MKDGSKLGNTVPDIEKREHQAVKTITYKPISKSTTKSARVGTWFCKEKQNCDSYWIQVHK